MLSLLIPVYQVIVLDFVSDLVRQSRRATIPFEIRVYDDGSPRKIQMENENGLSQWSEVIYKNLPKNIGRSAIRNLLAEEARFPFLLFMDCDSAVTTDQFISNYLSAMDDKSVLVGGRVYSSQKPKGKELHWLVGRAREVSPAAIRNQRPHHGFASNNFLIPKAIFRTIQFDVNIREYGHEDTVLGLQLAKKNIPIRHLDNELEHTVLEGAEEFLEKKKKALENLGRLSEKYDWMDTKLLKTYRKLARWKVIGLFVWPYQWFEKRIEANLQSSQPLVGLFLWYNLVWFDRYMRRRKE